ncbi:MAG: M23 family metallopeptidase [Flavisolibacter sp.]
MKRTVLITLLTFYTFINSSAQSNQPNYFRNPLDIPMQLVANFGEIRPNHWHMGLDIRTQHRVNLPVHAAANGYIARVSVESGGFGQAIYINHPNGYTTVYGHLNSFMPELAKYIKDKQYAQQSWSISLEIPSELFPVKKGQMIALSGSTGGSEGPHLHFEIRDTKTGNNLNPLLFHFPIEDNIPPVIQHLALYDRNISSYEQDPKLIPLNRTKGKYEWTYHGVLKTGSDKISFAIGSVDQLGRFGSNKGIFSASLFYDGQKLSVFTLNNISYDDSRYINAQVDYRYKTRGRANLQHITPLPGDHKIVYQTFNDNGIIQLQDNNVHGIRIEVRDAYGNLSTIRINIQYDAALNKTKVPAGEKFIPNNVNIADRNGFELYTTENSIYDTVITSYTTAEDHSPNSISSLHTFLDASIPVHDEITVRIKPDDSIEQGNGQKMVIRNISGKKIDIQRAVWNRGWLSAKFRQFGSFQAIVDNEPPTVNAPGAGEVIDLSRLSRLVFVPKDNLNSIRSFRAELDGNWLRFSNDKGHSWIYNFDEHFLPGEHELKVTIEDEAGNITVKLWKVKR